MKILRTKTVKEFIEERESTHLQRNLKGADLVMLGLGAIIGVGIFVITGATAANYSGPAITLSFALAGLVCIFTAFAYAELASTIPVAGGAYAYSYVVLGEFFAWMVGWAAMMIFVTGSASVAVGWSGYVSGILEAAGYTIPAHLLTIPSAGGTLNLLAVIAIACSCIFLLFGTGSHAKLNTILVLIKVAIIFVFIVTAVPHFDIKYWDNFMPFGFQGVAVGAATVIFAYSGFDMVANAAEECHDPKRDLPIGIIGSLIGAILLYVIISGLMTGIVSYTELDTPQPLALALRASGSNMGSAFIAAGAIAGLSSVLLMLLYAMSRLAMAISRDGLLPIWFAALNERFRTPHRGIIFAGIVAAILANLMPLQVLGQLTSLCSLVTFFAVSICVLILRIQQPELKRGFTCPAVYVVAPISALFCGYLVYTLFMESPVPISIAIVSGVIMYAVYGYRNSSMTVPAIA